jgi:hypothetical protein
MYVCICINVCMYVHAWFESPQAISFTLVPTSMTMHKCMHYTQSLCIYVHKWSICLGHVRQYFAALYTHSHILQQYTHKRHILQHYTHTDTFCSIIHTQTHFAAVYTHSHILQLYTHTDTFCSSIHTRDTFCSIIHTLCVYTCT